MFQGKPETQSGECADRVPCSDKGLEAWEGPQQTLLNMLFQVPTQAGSAGSFQP